jgi:hypothetical protein
MYPVSATDLLPIHSNNLPPLPLNKMLSTRASTLSLTRLVITSPEALLKRFLMDSERSSRRFLERVSAGEQRRVSWSLTFYLLTFFTISSTRRPFSRRPHPGQAVKICSPFELSCLFSSYPNIYAVSSHPNVEILLFSS